MIGVATRNNGEAMVLGPEPVGPAPAGAPVHEATRTFAPGVTAPAQARAFAVGAVRGWGFTASDNEILDDVAFVVTELSTNAVLHAHSPFTVRVADLPGAVVRVSVEDTSDRPPRVEAVTPNAETGRGLALTAKLADRWGYAPTPGGKVVWADLHQPLHGRWREGRMPR